MKALAWLDDLQALAACFSGYGIAPDMVGMSLAQAWGLYRFLCRLAGSGDA